MYKCDIEKGKKRRKRRHLLEISVSNKRGHEPPQVQTGDSS
jgi:hypothetical protein